jgi:hypothetical protein
MAVVHQSGPTYLTAHSAPGIRLDGYGYGLVSALHKRDGRVVAHSGGLPGFASHMEWLPDRGVGIVALANRTYLPVRSPIRDAFDVLFAAGSLRAPRTVISPALLAARDAIAALYERWDPGMAAETMLETYFLDLDDNRKPPNFPELRAAHCTALGPIAATGALRGSWRMTCEHGGLDVTVMISPTLPARVQFVTVTPVEAAAS